MSASWFNSSMYFNSPTLSVSSLLNFIFPSTKHMTRFPLLVLQLTVQGCSLKMAKTWRVESPHIEHVFLAHPVYSAGPGHAQPPAPTYPDSDHERSKAEKKGYHNRWWSL